MTFVQTVPGSHDVPRRVVRPTALCTIDHSVIAENIRLLRSKTDAKFMAVVKADAFGHGAAEVAATALAAGAAWLGVATVDEALQLRRGGVTAPILAWLVDPWSDLAGALRTQVTVSCANRETLEAVIAAAATAGIRADVHLEVDTGMSRAGTPAVLWPALCAQAKRAQDDGLRAGHRLWSHLALATDPDWSGVEPAWQAFHAGIDVALAAGLTPRSVHLANSAATLAHPRTSFTMVRCGASVYGIETVDGINYGLRYALRAVSHVTQLRRVPAGVGVGYGQKYVTRRPTTLGLHPGRLRGRRAPVARGSRRDRARQHPLPDRRRRLDGPVQRRFRRCAGASWRRDRAARRRRTRRTGCRPSGPPSPEPSLTKSSPASVAGCNACT